MIIAQTISLGIGFVLNLIFGELALFKAPLRLIDSLVLMLNKIFAKMFKREKSAAAFVLTLILAMVVCGGIPAVLLFFLYRFNIVAGTIAEGIIFSFMISAKSLKSESMDVYTELMRSDMNEARKGAARFANCDVGHLDDEGVTRAVVGASAEKTIGEVVSPIIYMAVGGAALCCIYRAIQAASRCRNGKKELSGGVCHVLDFIPARIAAYVMIVVSHILRFDGSNASYIHKRDAKKRAKSNVLQTKSTAAGALRVQLGHGENGDEIVGDAIRDIKFTTIKHMNTLMYMTAFASLVICAAVRVGICIVPWGMLDRIF